MSAEVAQQFNEEDQVIPDKAKPFEKALLEGTVRLHSGRDVYYTGRDEDLPENTQEGLTCLGYDNLGGYYATSAAYALVMKS